MKSLFVSDLHAALRLPFADVSPDGTTSDRLRDVLAVIADVKRVAEIQEVETIFILGDLFDKRHPDAPTLVAVARALKSLIGVDEDGMIFREVWILPGNHDAHDRSGKIYSLGMFEELRVPGLNVATKPTSAIIGEIEFILAPWVPETIFFDSIGLKPRIDLPYPRVFCIHQTIRGAVDGTYTAKSGLDAAEFEKHSASLVLSGHIHTPQVFGDSGRYLGSPLHLRFTDADDKEPRGFWLLDHEKLTHLAKKNASCLLALTQIEARAPKFVRWRFLADEDDDVTSEGLARDLLPDLLEELREDVLDKTSPGPYLEVIVEGDRHDVEAATEFVKASLDDYTGALRFRRISRIVLDDGASDRVREAATTTGKIASSGELADAYVDAMGDELDPELLKEFAREVLS